jgi:hypothetical protein
MISIPARWSAAVWCAAVLLLMLGVSSCSKDHPVNPRYPHTTKKTLPVPCDVTVTVDATSGPQPDPVYLCDDDTLTWVLGSNASSFVVEFSSGTPFADGATKFDDKHAAHPGQHQYGKLAVYKYSVTVTSTNNSTNKFDPQVVTGGNP